MPIFRWLIICLAVWLVIAILRRLIETRRQNLSSDKPGPASTYSATVACHHCNVHIPKAEALQNDGRYYCSKTCLTE